MHGHRCAPEVRLTEISMQDSNFKMVKAFHDKFGMGENRPPRPTVPALDVVKFRAKFMQEELDEFNLAAESHFQAMELTNPVYSVEDQLANMADMADALVDLVYVALGTADLMGLDFDRLFKEVQRANMAKQRAASAEESMRATGRGHSLDVVKPEGWQAPQIDALIEDAGWLPFRPDR